MFLANERPYYLLLFLLMIRLFLLLFLLTNGMMLQNLNNTSRRHILGLHRRQRVAIARRLFIHLFILPCHTDSPQHHFIFYPMSTWARSLLLHLVLWTFGCGVLILHSGQSGCPLHAAIFCFLLRVEFLFLFFVRFWFFSCHDYFIPPLRRPCRIMFSFGSRFCAPEEHKLWCIVHDTIDLGYPRLSLCRIHAFRYEWMLQYLYS